MTDRPGGKLTFAGDAAIFASIPGLSSCKTMTIGITDLTLKIFK